MPPTLRRRRSFAPALALLALSTAAPAAGGEDPRAFRHNPAQTAVKWVLHREVARPLPLTGYAGYNYEQFPHRRPVPTAAVRPSPAHPIGARLGRLFHHP